MLVPLQVVALEDRPRPLVVLSCVLCGGSAWKRASCWVAGVPAKPKLICDRCFYETELDDLCRALFGTAALRGPYLTRNP